MSPLSASLKHLLGEALERPITEVEQHVSFVKFDAASCCAMGVKPGTRGLLLEKAPPRVGATGPISSSRSSRPTSAGWMSRQPERTATPARIAHDRGGPP